MIVGMCKSYCSHGGRCELDAGHAGLHDSKYCTWTDEQALTREAADDVLAGKPGGAAFLMSAQPLADVIESLIDEQENR